MALASQKSGRIGRSLIAVLIALALACAGCGATTKTATVGTHTTAHVYAPLVKAAILRGCEKRNPPHYCECLLHAFERHLAEAQVRALGQATKEGKRKTPAWLKEAAKVCRRSK